MVHYCYLTLLLRKPQFNMFLQTANAIKITEFETIGFAGIRFGNTLDPQLVRMRLSCWLHMASGDADHWVKSVCGFSWCSTGFSMSASSICCFVCLVSSCVTFLSAWLVFKCVCLFYECVRKCCWFVSLSCKFQWKWSQLRFDPSHLFPIGAHFTRHQHSHATSCRHFHLGAPQAPISAEFPLGHASQPPQTGLATHLPPTHHPPLTALPGPPQFQDVPGPSFLPQALHQQYLIQQQLLEAQHRRILPHSR